MVPVLRTTFLLIFFFNSLEAGIYTNKRTGSVNSIIPKEINLLEENSDSFETKLLQRLKRVADSSNPTASPSPESFKSQLGNATIHNQALIHWSGDNSTVVFILTRRKNASPTNGAVSESALWRSTNYGKNYTLQANKFTTAQGTVILKSYYVCPTNKLKVIFVDTYNDSKRIWVSKDEGMSYVPHTVPFSVEKIEFHPEEDDWLLGFDKSTKSLYASMNLGEHWDLMGHGVSVDRYYWYVKGVDKGNDVKKIVHLEYRDLNLVPHEVYYMKSCYIPKCDVSDALDKYAKNLGNIDKDSLVVQDDYIVAQKSGSIAKLYVSHNREDFKRAQFPVNSEQTDFHLVSSDNKCLVMGVNHKSNLTHLFFSDVKGHMFTQTLSNVRYFDRKVGDNNIYTVDIHEVAGLLGIYFVNVQHPMTKNIHTVMSNNNGRTWSKIYSLHQDHKRKCMDECSLNFHLAMDQTKSGYYMPSIVSKKTIPGLIIAHGLWGSNLQDHPVTVNVFVSTDGGLTWRQVLQQRHLIVLADHGSILVGIKMIFMQTVSSLSFSNDYGLSWKKYQFSDEAINVDGILTEPGEHTFHLTLFGHKTYRDAWRIYEINMKPLFPRDCVYPDDFISITFINNSDPNVQEKPCTLGMRQTSDMLVAGSECLVGLNYKRKVTIERCLCRMDDYECDLGYFNKQNGRCKRVRTGPIDSHGSDLNLYELETPECVNGKMKNFTGLRRAPGNNCTNDLPNVYYTIHDCTLKPISNESIKVEIHNKTTRAKVGETLFFTVQHSSHDVVKWDIFKHDSPDAVIQQTSVDLPLKLKNPGVYQVRASSGSNSDVIFVEFWYPIERVSLYMPPVVATNRLYNATVVVETVSNIRGDNTLIGSVTYQWKTNPINYHETRSPKLMNLVYTKEGNFDIDVTVNNDVSTQKTKQKVNVKKFVQEIRIPLKSKPPLNQSELNIAWIGDFKNALKYHILQIDEVVDLLDSGKLASHENMHLFVSPELPLHASIYLAPVNGESERNLFEAAVQIQSHIMKKLRSFTIAKSHEITIQTSFIIDGEGDYMPYSSSNINGGVVALAVILVILVLAAFIIIFRKYASSARIAQYFRVRHVGGVPGMSHIVRNQNNDLSPIVGSEFIDDELDTMETIGTDQATLEFHG